MIIYIYFCNATYALRATLDAPHVLRAPSDAAPMARSPEGDLLIFAPEARRNTTTNNPVGNHGCGFRSSCSDRRGGPGLRTLAADTMIVSGLADIRW